MYSYVCTSCGKKVSVDSMMSRCDCGGLFRLDYTPPRFSLDLIDKSEFSIFRYRHFMPLHDDTWRDVTLGEGLTSTFEIFPGLYAKLDYAMPTLSFKDRGAAVLIAHAKSIGVTRVIQDSSGNAGNSIAAYSTRCGIECEIFVPCGTSEKKIAMIRSHGAAVTIFDGTRDETADACRKKAFDNKMYYANHVYNPFFYQGTKTYIYEVYEQLGRLPDNIFIPVGNGTLLLGCYFGIKELYDAQLISHFPKIFIVQSERCCPLYGAAGNAREITPEPTMAEGIAIGKPMRAAEILNFKYGGETEVILVPEDGILGARAELAKGGCFVEHTTAATYAAYKAYISIHKIIGDSLIPLCGAGLKSEK